MPDVAVLVGWLLVGWFCGTPPLLPPNPIHPPSPTLPPSPILPPDPIHPPSPIKPTPPEPDPWRGYLIGGVIGAVGGVIGGYVFAQLFGADYANAAQLLVTFVGALVGGRLLGDLGVLLMPAR
jgi:hypothetical protein